MAWTHYDIFISYSREDAAKVRPLVDELRRRGYRVFYDVESIAVGEKWKERLERSIRAARVLVLCWSESARRSEFVQFEFSRAEGLGKPVLPWLLDQTPLPAMIEIQGVPLADVAQVAGALQPKLGWTLARRRILHAVSAAALLAAIVFTGWLFLKPPPPPPPWEFHGEVTDRQTRMPIEGVEVIVQSEQRKFDPVKTDSSGKYLLRLPPPKPTYIHIIFRKEGYEADSANVPTSKPFDTDLQKLRRSPESN